MAVKTNPAHASKTPEQTASATSTSHFVLPSITFATVIEADHANLSTIARSIYNPTLHPSARLQLLLTLLWRLIRHDISEELVMRPAFARYMGDEGTQLAEHDRQDHHGLKLALMGLARRLDSTVDVDQAWLVGELKPLSREMAEHMREESGVVIPRFVGLVGEEVGWELGRRYVATLALTLGEDSETELRLSDVMEYADTDIEVFRGRLEGLERRAEEGVDGGYLRVKLRDELGRLGLSVDHICRQSGKSRGKL